MDDLEKKCTKRTAAEISAYVEEQKKFNKGLYERALLLKKGDNGFELRIPLRYLSRFFDLDFVWPAKRLMSIELKLNPASKNLIKEDSMKDAYDIQIVKIDLDISYVTLEESIRRSWYNLLESEKMVRVFDSVRETHFALNANSSVYFLKNVCPFGIYPRFLTIFFQTEEIHLGKFKNSYHYSSMGVSGLEVYCNGNSHYLNPRLSKLSLDDVASPDVFFFYEKFLYLYPETARSVSLAQFHADFFLFCIDLTPFDHNAPKDSLSLVTSGSIDLTIRMESENKKNLICYVHANHKSIVTVDVSGEILENE